jgi:long-chain acyl-CoA synthetase
VNVEKRIERSPYVAQAVVIGDAKPYLVALIVPEPDAIAALAREHGWPEEPLAARLGRADANRDLAKFEQLKKFRVLPAAFAIESGELTPTLKLKRRVIAEKYRTEIEALYDQVGH